MGDSSEYLVAVVGADVTQFRKSMRDVRNELGILAHEGTGLQNAFRGLGEALTYAVAAPLAVLGGGAVMAASEFEAAMRNINSVTFLTENAFAALTDRVFEFGKHTREGAVGAAEALNTIYQAGLTGEMAFSTLKATTVAAEAGLANMETTAEALTATMLSFGFTTEEQAMRSADALTRMVQVGVGSMQAFAGSIANFMPNANQLGVSMEEAFALEARLTQFGFSASEAATRLNNTMGALFKPTEDMAKALGVLGVSSATELIDKTGSLTEALAALAGTTDGSAEALGKLFGEKRALQGFMLITGDIEETRRVLNEFYTDLDGTALRAQQQQMMSFSYSWDRLTASMSAAAITLGDTLLPIVRPVVQGVTQFFMGITELDKRTLGFTVTAAALVAALAPAIWIFSSLLSPVAMVSAGILALASGFVQLAPVASAINTLFSDMANILAPVATEVDKLVTKLFTTDFSGANVVGAVSTTTDTMMQTVTAWRQEVKSGDTLWDVWYNNFLGKMTFEDFLKRTGFDGKDTMIKPGDILTMDSLVPREILGRKSAADDAATRSQPDWWEVLFGGLNTISVTLSKQLAGIRPKIDAAFGDFLTGIASAFVPTSTDGNSPVYLWIKSIVDGLLGAPQELQNAFPQITAGIGTFLTSVWDWFKGEAIPTATRTIGMVFGTIARVFTQAFTGLFNWISGGGVGQASSQAASFVDEALVTPFSQGLAEGLGDSAGLGASLSSAFEGLVDYLGGEFDRIRPLVEEKLTGFFNGIALYLSGQNLDKEGNTALYSGIRGAFTYIFDGGLGTDLEAQAGSLTTAFSNMLGEVGEWLVTNGVETLARGVGYLAGRVGVLIGQAFGAIGGGTDANGQSAIQDNLVNPLMEGFNDAFKDAGVADMNIGEKIITAVAGSIALVAVAKFGLFGAAAGAITWALGAAFSLVSFPFQVIGSTIVSMIAGGIATATKSVVGGLGSVATYLFGGKALSALASAAGNIVTAITYGFQHGGLAGVWTLLGQTFLGKIGAALTMAWGTVTATTGWIVAGATSIMTALGSAIATAATTMGLVAIPLALLLTVPGSTDIQRNIPMIDAPINVKLFPDFTLPSESEMSGMGGLGGQAGSDLGVWVRENMGDGIVLTDLPVHLTKITLTGTPEEIAKARDFFPSSDLGTWLASNEVQIPFNELFEIVPADGFVIGDYFNITNPYEVPITFVEGSTPTSSTQDPANNPIFQGMKKAIDAAAVNPTLNTAAVTFAENMVNTMLTNSETYMTEAGLDPVAVNSAFVDPMYDAINTGYGTEGTVTTLWSNFANTFSETASGLETTASNLSINLPPLFDALLHGLLPKLDTLIGKFDDLRDAANEANAAMGLGTGGGGGTGTYDGSATETPETPAPKPGEGNTVIHVHAPNVTGDSVIKALESKGIFTTRRK